MANASPGGEHLASTGARIAHLRRGGAGARSKPTPAMAHGRAAELGWANGYIMTLWSSLQTNSTMTMSCESCRMKSSELQLNWTCYCVSVHMVAHVGRGSCSSSGINHDVIVCDVHITLYIRHVPATHVLAKQSPPTHHICIKWVAHDTLSSNSGMC